MIVLFVVGCGASSNVDGGFEPAETLVLDGVYESRVSVEKGEMIALDILVPFKKGYRIVGVSFDPDMLRLEHYLEYEGDGMTRARYVYAVLMDGTSDLLVKMEPLAGGNVEIYKQVTVKVGGETGLF